MFSGRNDYIITIPAGTTLVLNVPLDVGNGHGYFPYPAQEIFFKNKILAVLNGFSVLNEDVGTLSLPEGGDSTKLVPTVLYTHKKQKENKIYFFSINGVYQTISIVNVPIHDHSSIEQGGPAFGTYYTDYKPE